jgi:hypothetical protein
MGNSKNKTVIILGNPRGGTSVAALMIKTIGVDLGKDINISSQNPTGDIEDKDFAKIIKKNTNYVHEISQINENYEIIDLIKNKNNNKVWGWKHPFTLLMVDPFIKHIDNPYLIFVYRNIENTAKSASSLDDLNYQEAKKRALRFKEIMDRKSKKYNYLPQLHISFEEIIEKPIDSAKKIADFLNLELTPKKKQKIKRKVVSRKRIKIAKKTYLIRKVFDKLHYNIWRRYQ